MAELEKVIKGLNDIGGFIAGRIGIEQARNFLRTIDDALALLKEQKHKDKMFHALEEDWKKLKTLLKEQEAVEPIYIENPYTHLPVSYCSKCREPINQYITGNPYRKTEYCHYCGQAVKWE